MRYPQLGGIRCAACEIYGGLVVSGRLTEQIRQMPLMSGQDVEDGHVALPACKPTSELESERAPWRKAGRPCPFVELSPENWQAADVVTYSLSEHTRGLSDLYAETVVLGLPQPDRAPFLDRVLSALQSEPVRQKLYPSVSENG